MSDGSIQVDGIDIRRFAVADYRRHIGLVLQEPFLFFGTIAENIAYGKPDATREEIVAAARPPMRTNSSCACRTATTRWSVSAARACRAASASAFRLPARC